MKTEKDYSERKIGEAITVSQAAKKWDIHKFSLSQRIKRGTIEGFKWDHQLFTFISEMDKHYTRR